MDKLKEQVDCELKKIEETGINNNNIEALYSLIDIKKDIAEIEEKEENSMRDREYGNYGTYYRRNYEDNYRGAKRGAYGRRGVDTRYQGDNYMDDMSYAYHDYEDMRGSYRAEDKDAQMESLEQMLESVVKFMEYLDQSANSQEEAEMIKKYARKLGNM